MPEVERPLNGLIEPVPAVRGQGECAPDAQPLRCKHVLKRHRHGAERLPVGQPQTPTLQYERAQPMRYRALPQLMASHSFEWLETEDVKKIAGYFHFNNVFNSIYVLK
jgi:hypothetical protein